MYTIVKFHRFDYKTLNEQLSICLITSKFNTEYRLLTYNGFPKSNANVCQKFNNLRAWSYMWQQMFATSL